MERVRFLHIPKTAGTTFTNILYNQYSFQQGKFCKKKHFVLLGDSVIDKKNFSELSEGEKSEVALFIGHAPMVTGVKEADSATVITFLRDPIARVKSFCQHVSEGKSQYLIKQFPPETFNLDKFLDSENAELSNLQTKMLINGRRNTFPLDRMSASEARDAALENLSSKIFLFGLQEFFEESLIIFSSAFNWKIPFFETKNAKNTINPIRFEERHIERLAEMNAIDIEVYGKAKDVFMDVINSEAFDNKKLKLLLKFNRPFIGKSVKAIRRLSS